MEADESIDVLGLPERNAYGSLVVADESEHSEEDIEASGNAQIEGENTAIDPDGETQLHNEVESSATQIQEFLALLNQEDMVYLLRNVLAMGRGSLDFAKKLLDEKNAPPPPPPSPGNSSPEWCKVKFAGQCQVSWKMSVATGSIV
ncbi:hypothetical protein OS493_011461 [Desmophyllum pertusum]|uniref:Uncharacterized protein n=1 Tax=Desmophyllum pertusum TaxID=174260 RepID=A0A9W9YQK7_9CNID|nr:hypothetical protein OS493_011461 [Desmophyllum pertusum]